MTARGRQTTKQRQMLFRVWVVAAGAWCCVGAEEVCTSEGAVELAARAVTLYGQGDFDGILFSRVYETKLASYVRRVS